MPPPVLKKILRHIWKISPYCLRENALVALCHILLPSRNLPVEGELIYVAGYFCAPSGLGMSARLYANELEAQGYEVIRIDLTASHFQNFVQEFDNNKLIRPNQLKQSNFKQGKLIIHINPPMFLHALLILRKLLPQVRVVGYWAWELEEIPSIWKRSLLFVDEVESPSSFTAQAIQKKTAKKVCIHPHAVNLDIPEKQRSFAEDGVVRVLFIFDMGSTLARKNPLAAIRAFQLAFGKKSNAHFTLKAVGVSDTPDSKSIIDSIAGWENITCISSILSNNEIRNLFLSHDIYLSLHRSEGYGLTLREAMLHGLHVVGTGWSGNMDFLQGDKCHPVPYTLLTIRNHRGPFRINKARWAEADIGIAAKVLREICQKEHFCLSENNI